MTDQMKLYSNKLILMDNLVVDGGKSESVHLDQQIMKTPKKEKKKKMCENQDSVW